MQVETQEATFKHIAREIHDNIGQKLTLAKLSLNLESVNNSRIENASDLISDSLIDLRELSNSFNPEIILNNGLVNAIEYEVMLIQKARKFEIGLNVDGDSRFIDKHLELVFFRISQEAISNIIKHSEASKILIHLNFLTENIELIISDNGNGFIKDDIKLTDNESGTGISNMTLRAHQAGGKLTIISSITKGTTISVKIPVKYEQFN